MYIMTSNHFIQLVLNKTFLNYDSIQHIITFLPPELNDITIREAIELWFKDINKAIKIYGNIEDWNTNRVTNMSYLFNYKMD